MTDSDREVPDRSSEDARIELAMELYLQQLESGNPPDREAFLEQFSDISEALAEQLETLEFLHRATPEVVSRSDLDVSDDLAAALNQTLGDFKLLRPLGRGGMGIVYEALQVSLDRRVAIKVLPLAAMLDVKRRKRLQNEARAAATFDRANIVPIHFVGQDRGVHFYAMQLIEGQSLAEVISSLKSEAEHSSDKGSQQDGVGSASLLSKRGSSSALEYYHRVADLGAQAAEALHHAHEHGVVHRDVKPGNLLFDESGKIWVADFGLAQLEASDSITTQGDVVGTMAYMSPEQLSGRELVDARTDIYSLAATLYELLTLERPFAPVATDNGFLRNTAPSLRRFDPQMPIDLQTVILKAMDEVAEERYDTALQLAEDLRRFCRDEPVNASRPSVTRRVARWTRRHRSFVVSASTALVACLLIALVLSSLAANRERHLREEAENNLMLAWDATDEMYTNIASTWIGDDSSLTTLQRRFLKDALAIYSEISSANIDGTLASAAAFREASIHIALRDYDSAAESLQYCVDVAEELLLNEDPPDWFQIELAERYEKLSQCYLELRAYDYASTALARGRYHLQEGSQLVPDSPRLRLLRLTFGTSQSRILFAQGQFDEAEKVAKASLDSASDYWWKNRSQIRDELPFRLSSIRIRVLQAAIYRKQERLEEALKIVDEALTKARFLSNQYRDSSELLEVTIATREELAETAIADDRLADAANQLRQSLELRKRKLTDGRSPGERYMADWMANRRAAGVEVELYCDYFQVQFRLADVLIQMGRRYEADEVLGEAYQTCCNMGGSERSKANIRQRLAHAQCSALLSRLYKEWKTRDSELARDTAIAAWRALDDDFRDAKASVKKQIAESRSVYSHLVNENISASDLLPCTKQLHKRAFFARSYGHLRFRLKDWSRAIAHFKSASQKSGDDCPWDYSHIAMAHHELGEQTESTEAFERALAAAETESVVHQDLKELLDRTAKEIGQPTASADASK